MAEVRYWPFDVLPVEKQSPHHREVICFLKQAFVEGFCPYMFDNCNYGAAAQQERTGVLIHRGGNRYWEAILLRGDNVTHTLYVDGFPAASEVILEWLRGQCASGITNRVGSCVLRITSADNKNE